MDRKYIILTTVISIALIVSSVYLVWTHTDVDWEHEYGRGHIQGIEHISDGECIVLGGLSADTKDGRPDAWILRVDSNGEEILNKKYDPVKGVNLYFSDVIVLNDGYLVSGEKYDYRGDGGRENLILVKMDEEGDVLWNKSYGKGEVISMEQVEDGYMIYGTIEDGGLVIKVNHEGEMQYRKTQTFDFLPSLGDGDVSSVWIREIFKKDEGYFFFGDYHYSDDSGEGVMDQVLFKLDEDCNLTSAKPYDSEYYAEISDVIEVGDGYIIGGRAKFDGNSDVLIMKVDESGDKKWTKRIGDGEYQSLQNLVKAEDGYLITGDESKDVYFDFKDTEKYDYFMAKIDDSGNVLWKGEYGEYFKTERGIRGVQVDDDKYISAGYYNPPRYEVEVIGFHEPESPWNFLNTTLLILGIVGLAVSVYLGGVKDRLNRSEKGES